MTSHITELWVVALLVASIGGMARQGSSANASLPPSLINVCLITNDVSQPGWKFGEFFRAVRTTDELPRFVVAGHVRPAASEFVTESQSLKPPFRA